MDITMIINEIANKGILRNIVASKPLSGGTTSKLFLLHDSENRKYVVKFNEPHVLKAESHFLAFYKDVDFLPSLLYAEPAYQYIIYTFVAGAVDYPRKNKKEMLQTLVQHLINHYKPVTDSGSWGWVDDPSHTWQQFLQSRAHDSTKTLKSYLEQEDHDLVMQLINSSDRSSNDKPYVLHGDCGVHNFIFNDEQFDGVIDPTPVNGGPLYDLIYAFCSSPDHLTEETISSAAILLQAFENKNDRLLHEEVLIGLYFRMATCVRHHPEDLEPYLKAWDYWKNKVHIASFNK
jgi:Phosphotransferase enzyme family